MTANIEVQGVAKAADIPKALASGQYRSAMHY